LEATIEQKWGPRTKILQLNRTVNREKWVLIFRILLIDIGWIPQERKLLIWSLKHMAVLTKEEHRVKVNSSIQVRLVITRSWRRDCQHIIRQPEKSRDRKRNVTRKQAPGQAEHRLKASQGSGNLLQSQLRSGNAPQIYVSQIK
jgi:hypothetical protein